MSPHQVLSPDYFNATVIVDIKESHNNVIHISNDISEYSIWILWNAEEMSVVFLGAQLLKVAEKYEGWLAHQNVRYRTKHNGNLSSVFEVLGELERFINLEQDQPINTVWDDNLPLVKEETFLQSSLSMFNCQQLFIPNRCVSSCSHVSTVCNVLLKGFYIRQLGCRTPTACT